MPLVRFEVKNEYGLGAVELYGEANKDDPKEILDGVAVAGLVGVLRQLGDLSEFATELLHGLQEEVTIVSSRSRKLMARIKQIEAAFSPLEKNVLAQRTHLHFAYSTGKMNAGTNCHASRRCDQNHFVYSDIPQFIMDCYEDCHSPPRLHLLDRFDPDGHGSCLRRLSDPNFFSWTPRWTGEAENAKMTKDSTNLRIKKKCFQNRNGEVSRSASYPSKSGRAHYSHLNTGNTTTSQAIPTPLKSMLDEISTLDLRNGLTCNDGDPLPSYSMGTEAEDEEESRESISSPTRRHYVDDEFLDYIFLQEKVTDPYDYIQVDLSQGQAVSPLTLEEKMGALESAARKYGFDLAHENDYEINDESVEVDEDNENLTFSDHLGSVASFRKQSRNISPRSYTSTQASVTGNLTPAISASQAAGKKKEIRKNLSQMGEKGSVFQIPEPDEKLLHSDYKNSILRRYQNSGSLDQKIRQDDACRKMSGSIKDTVGFVSSSRRLSPSSSPPLGHMKIPFQPIDGLETAKLKLKLKIPLGTNNYETARDCFPSFQLVPEVSFTRHDFGSDSDGDSCRSAESSLADECLSNRSDQMFEQWESCASHSGKNTVPYDLLHKISVAESPSIAHENERKSHHESSFAKNGIQNSRSVSSFDFQSLSTLNYEEPRIYSRTNVIVQEGALTPTPPLPPVHWWGMKPSLHDNKGRRKATSEGSNSEFDQKLLESKISGHSMLASLILSQDHESTTKQKNEQSELVMFNQQNEGNQPQRADEKNFLHQIRTKSLNLRPISRARPTQGIPTNVQVSAILRKASVIRLAVGSDDGEVDSNWSDT